jgi:hypothetical protein
MKIIYKSFVFLYILFITNDSYAQKMVQTPRDLPLLCQNDGEFVGKSLKSLLDQIEPSIGMVFAEGGWSEVAPRFSFYFMMRQQFDSCRNAEKTPLRLTVYTKEFFKWEYNERKSYLTSPFEWTKKDIESYGNLTVAFIRVSGVCQPDLQ